MDCPVPKAERGLRSGRDCRERQGGTGFGLSWCNHRCGFCASLNATTYRTATACFREFTVKRLKRAKRVSKQLHLGWKIRVKTLSKGQKIASVERRKSRRRIGEPCEPVWEKHGRMMHVERSKVVVDRGRQSSPKTKDRNQHRSAHRRINVLSTAIWSLVLAWKLNTTAADVARAGARR